ncbi:MAG: hypothetical protein R2728_10660 [Chitinophagales bacterium]
MSEVLSFEQIKKEYEAAKTAFESTPRSEKTPEDFTYYNYTVRNYNMQANQYNAVNNYLYTERNNQVTCGIMFLKPLSTIISLILMSSIDKRDKLIEDPFTYKNVKDEKVLIYEAAN